jgi:succinate dehydrogenase/fumarate reductase cytochrome b subunit
VAIASVVDALAVLAYLFHGLVDFAVLLIDLGVTIVLISGRRPTDAARGGPLGISSRRSG